VQQYQFRIDVPDLLSRNGTFTLRQEPVPLLGDYNRDAVVDAADYVAWRKTDGTLAGYNLWRTNFGRTAVGGFASSTTVPEPAAALLLVLGAIMGCFRTMPTGVPCSKTRPG
jgi:hypothetical protein